MIAYSQQFNHQTVHGIATLALQLVKTSPSFSWEMSF